MVSFANTFNKGRLFEIDTKDFVYVKLSELYGTDGADVIHPVDGFIFHHGKLGKSVVIIDEQAKKLVNVPSHMADTFEEISKNAEAVETIKNHKVGYIIYTYESHGRECYNIRFVDL